MAASPKEIQDAIKHIGNNLESPNESDHNGEAANIVDALFFIGRSLDGVADALRCLGNGNASTNMGAIEAASVKIGGSIERGLSDIADAVRSREAT